MKVFTQESGDYKRNAQRNLSGITHYCDDDTLKYFHARIVNSRESHKGLLFWIIESSALNSDNTKRGFRPVVFDIAGETIFRPELENCFKTHEQAKKSLNGFLAGITQEQALEIAKKAIERKAKISAREIDYITEQVKRV